MSNNNGTGNDGNLENNRNPQISSFYGLPPSFSITAPMFLVSASQQQEPSAITGNSQIASTNQALVPQLTSSSHATPQHNMTIMQVQHSNIHVEQMSKPFPNIPVFQSRTLIPTPVEQSNKRRKTKTTGAKQICYSKTKTSPIEINHFKLQQTTKQSTDKASNKTKKRSPNCVKAELRDFSTQTSGWKFMSEIGTIESMKNENKNRDKQVSKSSMIAALRAISRKVKEKVELMNYESFANHVTVMDDAIKEFLFWMKHQYIETRNMCLLCEQSFLSEQAVHQHLVSSCVVLRNIFEETVVGLSQVSHTDDVAKEQENKAPINPSIIQDIFSKSYIHNNDPESLKLICMFCGEKVKCKEVLETDLYLDKRHVFDSCIVFKSFLVFHNQSYILATSQKVGTAWTFLYYYTLLNYFAMDFAFDISDLRFLKEDKALLVLRNMENITENIIHRATECPLCYANITNPGVLKHHIVFSLCPFLVKLCQDMKLHVKHIWKVPGQQECLRKITSCFQYFMSYQDPVKPITIKQSIMDDILCSKLLENAMYFKSLDNNFTLQFYKTPKDVAVAHKIEEMQQKWAEDVMQDKGDTECPFCFTIFNNEKNLLKHIVYISCKSIRPVCNQIYNLLEFSEWDVLSPVAIVTQHTCYILKEAILRGEYEINLTKEQLTEYITIVTGKFLNMNLTDKIRKMLFESTEVSIANTELTPDELSIFQDFYAWAKRAIKKKNGSVCPLCGRDEQSYNILVNHIALGACPYIKQFLLLMDEIYKYNHVFRPCPAPTKIAISKNRLICFDFVHHIRKVLFLFKASKKTSKFFDHDEFEMFLINSPQNYIKHNNLMSIVIGNNATSCSFCFMNLKSRDHLLLHLLFLRCPTITFVIDLVKNEWNKCSKGSAPTEKMLDIIKIYSSMFELDPCTVVSSSHMKKYFKENNNITMLNNFKNLKTWSQEMFRYDAESTLNICNACNIAAENIEMHLWLEEPVENFCPEIKSYLDFHRKMVCKKDNRGEIRAAFTVTDLFELKRFIQCQFSYMYKRPTAPFKKESIISPTLKTQIKNSISMTLKIYPRYDGTMESFKLMYGTSQVFLTNQLAIADKIAVSRVCFLCEIMFHSEKDVRYHIATFECRILQQMLQEMKSLDQIDNDIMKNELMNAYKRTVAFCREQYPNLNEGNLLLVMETVDPQCHSKLYNFIMSKIPRINPYKCLFCPETCNSMGEIYTHYKKIQCIGLRECFGFIPNKGPVDLKHPFLHIVYNIFVSCYNTFGIRNHTKLKSLLVGINNLADMYEFWCSNYCDSLVPSCQFCGQGLVSVSAIKAHPKTCPKLRETNLELFRSDRLKDSSFMKQQGLGSCKLTGELPREVIKESEGVPFMQRYRCSQYLGWIPLCLECATSTTDDQDVHPDDVPDEETCRFLLFRRLIKRDNRLSVFDFESSQTVANIANWVPARSSSVPELEVQSAKYILRHLLPHFNQLMTFELWELENAANIRLKHQVKNVRELCDSCMTTLFNIHLFCPRCGFVICMDCYRDRLAGVVSTGLNDCSDGSVHNLTALDTCVTIPPRAVKQLCSAVEAIKDMHCISVTDLPFTRCPTDDIPYEMICNGQVLALLKGEHPRNHGMFQKFHQKGNAIVVYGLQAKADPALWSPESFSKHFGQERELVVNTSTLEVHRISLKDFFDGFENVNERPRNENGDPMVLKLKDWPTTWDFKEKLPQWYEDFMKVIPLKPYTLRNGLYNIARYLPNIYCRPDLGPKMYIAYSNANNPNEGSTVLHIDISDAVNIIMYVGQSQDVVINYEDDDHIDNMKHDSSYLKRKVYTLRDLCEDTDDKQLERVRRDKCKLGALWHIYHPNDIDKIRHFITKVLNENGHTLPSGHDPIHDQAMYLDKDHRKRLFQEYGVKGWPVAQCEGDAVFIPAGAPHQVRNLQSCIKIAEDFVSPERVMFCLKHTQEIRHLTKQHSNQEDKLQMKNLLYHGVKECVSVLQNHIPTKDLCTCKPVEMCAAATQSNAGVQDARDQLIEDLQAELEQVRQNNIMEKGTLQKMIDNQEAIITKIKSRYDAERSITKDLNNKLTRVRKNVAEARSQTAQNVIKVVPTSYQSKPEQRVQEIQSADQRPRSSSSSSNDRRVQYSQFEPPGRVISQIETPQPGSAARDPRLKHKMVEGREKHANAGPIHTTTRWDHRYARPTGDLIAPGVVPKSAFQGVQHAVNDLRKKQPPPHKVRKTPETPEPMDTNQDSCSPRPGSSAFHEGSKNNLELLSCVSASQPRSYPSTRAYDPGASNSETDSNEEVNGSNHVMSYSQYPNSYTPVPPANKTPAAFNSPSVSPGFNPKSLNLQISSPKQPAIFAKHGDKKATYQKVKEELIQKPRQISPRQISPRQSSTYSKPTTLSEIFPLQPIYTNTYTNAKQALQCKKPIKTELRTPPNEKINPPTFAPHLASYLPGLLTRTSNSERATWNTDPPKTVQSPVTPTMSPPIISQANLVSPATPSPPLICKPLDKQPPVVQKPRQLSGLIDSLARSCPAPKVEIQPALSSCTMLDTLSRPESARIEPTKTSMVLEVRRATIPVSIKQYAEKMATLDPIKLTAAVMKSAAGIPDQDGCMRSRSKSKSSDSFISIESSSSDPSTVQKQQFNSSTSRDTRDLSSEQKQPDSRECLEDKPKSDSSDLSTKTVPVAGDAGITKAVVPQEASIKQYAVAIQQYPSLKPLVPQEATSTKALPVATDSILTKHIEQQEATSSITQPVATKLPEEIPTITCPVATKPVSEATPIPVVRPAATDPRLVNQKRQIPQIPDPMKVPTNTAPPQDDTLSSTITVTMKEHPEKMAPSDLVKLSKPLVPQEATLTHPVVTNPIQVTSTTSRHVADPRLWNPKRQISDSMKLPTNTALPQDDTFNGTKSTVSASTIASGVVSSSTLPTNVKPVDTTSTGAKSITTTSNTPSTTTNVSENDSDTGPKVPNLSLCPPEPEKMIIFDEMLLSRLSKKRDVPAVCDVNSGTVPELNKLAVDKPLINERMLANPLLRRKVNPTVRASQRVTRKQNLTDTVDAILKSDKLMVQSAASAIDKTLMVQPATSAAAIDKTLMTFDKIRSCLSSLRPDENLPAPVLRPVLAGGVSRLARRSRESSGNSIGNMPVLSPISPASTPPPPQSSTPPLPISTPPLPASTPPPPSSTPPHKMIPPPLPAGPPPSLVPPPRPTTPPTPVYAQPPVQLPVAQSSAPCVPFLAATVQIAPGLIATPAFTPTPPTVSTAHSAAHSVAAHTPENSPIKTDAMFSKKKGVNYRIRELEEGELSDDGVLIPLSEIQDKHRKRKMSYEQEYKNLTKQEPSANIETSNGVTVKEEEISSKRKSKKSSKKKPREKSKDSKSKDRHRSDSPSFQKVKRPKNLDNVRTIKSSDSRTRKPSLESVVVYNCGTDERSCHSSKKRSGSTDQIHPPPSPHHGHSRSPERLSGPRHSHDLQERRHSRSQERSERRYSQDSPTDQSHGRHSRNRMTSPEGRYQDPRRSHSLSDSGERTVSVRYAVPDRQSPVIHRTITGRASPEEAGRNRKSRRRK